MLISSCCLAGDVILVSPAVPVMEGDNVSLYCKNKMADSNLPADFYKDGLLSMTGYQGNFTINSVSKSHEGLYKCSISGTRESAESWLTVRGKRKTVFQTKQRPTKTKRVFKSYKWHISTRCEINIKICCCN